jgi:hypothetical protein
MRPREAQDGGNEIAVAWRPEHMEALFIFIVLIGSLALFGAAAMRWGVDSREPIRDDHRR